MLIFFFNRPRLFLQLPGGWLLELRPPIANFRFETPEINYAPIMLNCAAILFTCAGTFFHDAITRGRILRNCTYFLFENYSLVLRDTKWVSPENSSRSQNLRIRSLELKESIVYLLFDTEVCWRTLRLRYLPQRYCSPRKRLKFLKLRFISGKCAE